jgi:hypothetical protein
MADTNIVEITNKDLVLFALYELGGAQKLVHTEDVAVQVFRYPLGKQWYQWERYAEYPDKERVARELRRLKNAKGTAFVKGHVNIGAKKDRLDGWMLTAAGVDRIRAIEKQIMAGLGKEEVTHCKYKLDKLIRRITTTSCYQIYLKDPTLSEAKDHDFTDMLYCLPDASSQRVQDAYDKFLANAKDIGATDLIKFLEVARERFGGFFSK